MKLIFSLSLLLSSHLCIGREIVLLTHAPGVLSAALVKELMINQYNVPESFVKVLELEKPCKKRNAVLHLCFKDEGDIDVVTFKKMVGDTLMDFKELDLKNTESN